MFENLNTSDRLMAANALRHRAGEVEMYASQGRYADTLRRVARALEAIPVIHEIEDGETVCGATGGDAIDLGPLTGTAYGRAQERITCEACIVARQDRYVAGLDAGRAFPTVADN